MTKKYVIKGIYKDLKNSTFYVSNIVIDPILDVSPSLVSDIENALKIDKDKAYYWVKVLKISREAFMTFKAVQL